jgi:hypothetical protein
MLTAIIGTSIGAAGLYGTINGYIKRKELISKKTAYTSNIVPYAALAVHPHTIDEFIMQYNVPADSATRIHNIVEHYIRTRFESVENLEHRSGIRIGRHGIKPIHDISVVTTTKEISEHATKTIDILMSMCPFNSPNVSSTPFPKIFIESFYGISKLEENTHDFNSLHSKLWLMNGYKLALPRKSNLFYKDHEYTLANRTIYVNAKKINDAITYSLISANPQDLADNKFDDDITYAEVTSVVSGMITVASVCITCALLQK